MTTDDNQIFEIFFVVLVIGIMISNFIDRYDYNQLINDMNKLIFVAIFFSIFIVVLVYFVMRWISKRKEAKEMRERILNEKNLSKSLRECTTEKESSKSLDNCTTEKKSSRSLKGCTTEIVKSEIVMLTEKPKVEVSINVDESKGFYKYKNLNFAEIDYLLSKKYVLIKKRSVSSDKIEKFLIKPRFNESLNHCFVVYDIADFLEKQDVKFSLFVTRKPDLVFEIDRKVFAIEVETGNKIDKDKNLILEKVKQLKNDYDSYFFVVLNRNFVKKYKKLAVTIDVRYLSNKLRKIVKNRH